MTQADPTAEVPVRDAATVVLLRDGADGVEVWLLTRVTGMAFAAGMSVFPGGRVEDADAAVPMDDGPLDAYAARFGESVAAVRALVGAAVRETYEETGVLLTEPPAVLSDARAGVEAGRTDFAQLLRTHGLRADAGALRPWSRWVTPGGERRRYDARFFVGRLPADAVPADVTSESSTAEWVAVRTALEQAERGDRRLMPPTLVTLGAIADHASVAEVLAAAEHTDLAPVRPMLHVADDGAATVELPGGRRILIRPGRTT